MQVFGLLGHVRNGRAASHLIDAETADIAAAMRRDAVARSRHAMAKGLSAADAATSVGVPRSTLYRWRDGAAPKSRRPHNVRKPVGCRR